MPQVSFKNFVASCAFIAMRLDLPKLGITPKELKSSIYKSHTFALFSSPMTELHAYSLVYLHWHCFVILQIQHFTMCRMVPQWGALHSMRTTALI